MCHLCVAQNDGQRKLGIQGKRLGAGAGDVCFLQQQETLSASIMAVIALMHPKQGTKSCFHNVLYSCGEAFRQATKSLWRRVDKKAIFDILQVTSLPGIESSRNLVSILHP